VLFCFTPCFLVGCLIWKNTHNLRLWMSAHISLFSLPPHPPDSLAARRQEKWLLPGMSQVTNSGFKTPITSCIWKIRLAKGLPKELHIFVYCCNLTWGRWGCRYPCSGQCCSLSERLWHPQNMAGPEPVRSRCLWSYSSVQERCSGKSQSRHLQDPLWPLGPHSPRASLEPRREKLPPPLAPLDQALMAKNVAKL
jgi:hypothetical protein